MATDSTIEDVRRSVSAEIRQGLGMIRRVVVTLTKGAFWQIAGHILLDGKIETHEPEVFSGVSFWARPRPGSKVDAVMLFAGGAQNPILVATRDEDLRKKVAADLDQDEAMAANSVAVVHWKKDGTVEVRSPGGTARKVAFSEELDDLRAYVAAQFSGVGHAHPVSGGATAGTTPVGVAPGPGAYPGTDVLKGE